jgi:Ca-activated chloride channel family protein
MTRLLVCSALVLSSIGLSAAQQPQVFREAADTVRVFVTVLDRDERLVANLTREQFEVRDNGRPQPLTLFDNSPQPIQLIAMIDVSGSMRGNLGLLRAASEHLFARLGETDAAKVGTFGRDVVISPEFTRDASVLRAALPAEIKMDAPTPLWRGVDQAMSAFEPSDRRRVVLILSDGKDSGPTSFRERFVSQLEIIERARRENVMIYGVGLRSNSALGRQPGATLQEALMGDMPDPGLGRAATESGGGYFEIRPRDDLGTTFARVVDELHSQYLLGFAPPLRDGKSHRIEVRLSVRNLEARARRSYQAPASAAR